LFFDIKIDRPVDVDKVKDQVISKVEKINILIGKIYFKII
jgi:hypothetical protein